MINTVDKGSRVILQTEMTNETSHLKFKRMYVRFNAQKIGFLDRCRPFIGLDGCHIKYRFDGQILSAIAKDANDNIFPVAMAVVEQETRESWIWFLEIFAEDIGMSEELKLVFISDRQKVCKFCFVQLHLTNTLFAELTCLFVCLFAGAYTCNRDTIPYYGA